MSETETILQDGGVVTVVLGEGYELPSDFVFNPRVKSLDARKLSAAGVAGAISANTKAVILSDHIHPPVYHALKDEIKRRRLIYLMRRDQESLDRQLREFFPLPPKAAAPSSQPVSQPNNGQPSKKEDEEKTQRADRGAVPGLIREFWDRLVNVGNAEGARILLPIAAERKIPTTSGSLQQAIYVEKRKRGATGVPASIRPKHEEILRVFDDAIAGLTLCRDWIGETVGKVADQEARMAKVEEALRAIRGE